MNRRDSILAIAALGGIPHAVQAQQGNRIPVIGFLHSGSAGTVQRPSTTLQALRAGLESQGYFEGKTIRIEARFAEGKPEQSAALAQELTRLKLDLIVAVGPSSVKAAQASSKDLPIVAQDLETDPVASGLISTLAKPGGNLTGLFLNHADLAAKWLQLITEAVPSARRIAVLWDVATGPYQIDAIKAAVDSRLVQLSLHEFSGSDGLRRALDNSLKSRPGAIVQLGSPLINQAAKAIAGALAAQRVPGISPFRAFAENGGLLSYGVNLPVMYRSLATFIDKILRGAKPGELPIEQPTHFELVINLQTAKTLGLTIPQSLLVRADEVIR